MTDHDPLRPPHDDDASNPYAAPEAEISTGPRVFPLEPGRVPFSAERVMAQSWRLYQERFGLVFGLVNLPIWISMLYQLVGSLMAETVDQDSTMGKLANLMFAVAGAVMQIWLTSGTSLALLKVVRGEPAEIGDIFHGGPFVLRIFGAVLLYTVAALVIVAVCLVPAGIMGYAGSTVGMVVGGLVGLMVAMVIALFLAARLNQYTYLVIDRDAGPIESLRWSCDLTSGHVLELAGLLLVGFAVGLGGLLLCFVGYFFTVPWMMLLFVCTYVALVNERPVGRTFDKVEKVDNDVEFLE
jgi:hypothetical protein